MLQRWRTESAWSRKDPWPSQWHWLSATPALAVVLIFCFGRILNGPLILEPLLAVPPALAGIGATKPGQPLGYGAIGLLVAGVLATGISDTTPLLTVATVISVVAVTAVSAAGAVLSSRRNQSMAELTTVAEVAQRALLRPPPRQVGPLELRVLYLAAAAEARVGGDLYEVVRTRYGIRLIMGDVRGKGLDAVEIAADVLGVFREAAHEVYTLGEVARRLDASLVRRGGSDEEFVTAVLMEVDSAADGVMIYNCGHPAPILLSPGGRGDGLRPSLTIADVPLPAPPLGLMSLGDCSGAGRKLSLRPGDELLLYTDGVTEARDARGRFYPLAERLQGLAAPGGDGAQPDLLELVRADLLRHVGARPDDDVALLLLRVAGAPAVVGHTAHEHVATASAAPVGTPAP